MYYQERTVLEISFDVFFYYGGASWLTFFRFVFNDLYLFGKCWLEISYFKACPDGNPGFLQILLDLFVLFVFVHHYYGASRSFCIFKFYHQRCHFVLSVVSVSFK